jgi:hypothetical protein
MTPHGRCAQDHRLRSAHPNRPEIPPIATRRVGGAEPMKLMLRQCGLGRTLRTRALREDRAGSARQCSAVPSRTERTQDHSPAARQERVGMPANARLDPLAVPHAGAGARAAAHASSTVSVRDLHQQQCSAAQPWQASVQAPPRKHVPNPEHQLCLPFMLLRSSCVFGCRACCARVSSSASRPFAFSIFA